MEGSPFAHITRDREVHQEVEKTAVSLFESPEMRKFTIETFFGCDESILTREEGDRFAAFAEHAEKRILFADIHKEGAAHNTTMALMLLEEAQESIKKRVVIHDIAHSLVTLGEEKEGNDIAPPFYKSETRVSEIADRTLLAQEAEALLFARTFGDTPLSLCLFDETAKTELKENVARFFPFSAGRLEELELLLGGGAPKTFADYVEQYQQLAYGVVLCVNETALAEEIGLREMPSEIKESLLAQAQTCVTELKQNTNERLLSYLEHIYQNREDTKVLYTLFESIAGEYVDRIKKRA